MSTQPLEHCLTTIEDGLFWLAKRKYDISTRGLCILGEYENHEKFIKSLRDFPVLVNDFRLVNLYNGSLRVLPEIPSKLIRDLGILYRKSRSTAADASYLTLKRFISAISLGVYRRYRQKRCRVNMIVTDSLADICELLPKIRFMSCGEENNFAINLNMLSKEVDLQFVIQKIENACTAIRGRADVSQAQANAALELLYQAKTEALNSRPHWYKIVSVLMFAAAITSGLADGPNAKKTIDEVISHITGAAVGCICDENSIQLLPKPEHKAHSDVSDETRNGHLMLGRETVEQLPHMKP